MAREHARVSLSIWEDDEFRALPGDAQRLYFVLMTHAKLDYCGVTDWRPARLAPFCADWTVESVEQAAKVLSEASYIVVDDESEEVLLRSFIRHDGLLESPNMAVAVRKAYTAVASPALRGVVIHELVRLHSDKPDLKGWAKVSDLLQKPTVNPSDYPSFNPSGNPSVKGSANPSGMADPNPSSNPSPTPAPSPAPSPAPPSGSARKRASQIPKDWKPGDKDVAWQREQGISDLVARRELPIFVDHWTSKAEARADWPAAWRNWLRRVNDFGPRKPPARDDDDPMGWAR